MVYAVTVPVRCVVAVSYHLLYAKKKGADYSVPSFCFIRLLTWFLISVVGLVS